MDLEEIKRGLRAEIKKRENVRYLTFQTNIRQMCKDVLDKLEEQEKEIENLKTKIKGETFVIERSDCFYLQAIGKSKYGRGCSEVWTQNIKEAAKMTKQKAEEILLFLSSRSHNDSITYSYFEIII